MLGASAPAHVAPVQLQTIAVGFFFLAAAGLAQGQSTLIAGWNFNDSNLTVDHGTGSLTTSGLGTEAFLLVGSSQNLSGADGDAHAGPLSSVSALGNQAAVYLRGTFGGASLPSTLVMDNVQISAVPEPAPTAVLCGALGLLLAGARRRRA